MDDNYKLDGIVEKAAFLWRYVRSGAFDASLVGEGKVAIKNHGLLIGDTQISELEEFPRENYNDILARACEGRGIISYYDTIGDKVFLVKKGKDKMKSNIYAAYIYRA